MPKRTDPNDFHENNGSVDFLSDDELDGLKDAELDDAVGGKVVFIPILGVKPIGAKPTKT